MKDPIFFCGDCEAKGSNITPRNHDYIHTLLDIEPPIIDPTIKCTQCDAWEESNELFYHDETHDLVWCQRLVDDGVALSTEIRLANLEERFSRHELAMDEKFAQLQSEVGTRLTRVENMLEAILGKLGVPAATSR